MSTIPLKIRKEMSENPYYKTCARKTYLNDHECKGNIEWEHALYSAGSKVQKPFAIVPLCWLVHSGPKLWKEVNIWIALNQATDEELKSISKVENYIQKRNRLNKVYGIPAKKDEEIHYE